MQPDQEIRDAALVHAISFSKAVIQAGTEVPPENIVYAADVFAAYIAGGAEAAHRAMSHAANPAGPPEDSSPIPEIPPTSPVQLPSVPSQTPSSPPGGESGNVVPLAGRDATSSHNPARQKIEAARSQRAQGIAQRARVAKAPEHKAKLLKEMRDSGLESAVVKVDSQEILLETYLVSLGCITPQQGNR